jgi:hypothetical protein
MLKEGSSFRRELPAAVVCVYFTVKLTLVLWLMFPSVPVNVSVNVPWLTFIDANKVIVVLTVPFNMTVLGVIVQVELGGLPLQLRDTLPVSPVPRQNSVGT